MTLEQNSTNYVSLSLDLRKEASEYYMLEFMSLGTKTISRVFPTVTTETERAVEFTLDVSDSDSFPLGGTVQLITLNSYSYNVYATNEVSLTPSSVVWLGTGLMQLKTIAVQSSTYEDIENIKVYFGRKSCTVCLIWNSEAKWDLTEDTWTCD